MNSSLLFSCLCCSWYLKKDNFVILFDFFSNFFSPDVYLLFCFLSFSKFKTCLWQVFFSFVNWIFSPFGFSSRCWYTFPCGVEIYCVSCHHCSQMTWQPCKDVFVKSFLLAYQKICSKLCGETIEKKREENTKEIYLISLYRVFDSFIRFHDKLFIGSNLFICDVFVCVMNTVVLIDKLWNVGDERSIFDGYLENFLLGQRKTYLHNRFVESSLYLIS